MWQMILGTSTMLFVVLPLIIGTTIIVGLKIIKGDKSVEAGGISNDETETIQEIYKGLARMEERVNTLETILLDRDYKEGE